METRINVAELIKNCPKGMELDCIIYDNVTLESATHNGIHIRLNTGEVIMLSTNGSCFEFPYSKCVIFPKGKTTWEGFVSPCNFKDGDMVAAPIFTGGTWIGIFKQYEETTFEVYCSLTPSGRFNDTSSRGHILEGTHLATEEEKKKLFQAISINGYIWDVETKSLKKVKPKFKVGDRIQYKGANYKPIYIIKSLGADRYIFDNDDYIKFGDEDNYSLLKFDINTLKHFDKVLVRDCNADKWDIDFFGYCIKGFYHTTGRCSYKQCIPYKGNEHIVGKRVDCAEFYKNWEE